MAAIVLNNNAILYLSTPENNKDRLSLYLIFNIEKLKIIYKNKSEKLYI